MSSRLARIRAAMVRRISSLASNARTGTPARAKTIAQAEPTRPAPTTAADRIEELTISAPATCVAIGRDPRRVPVLEALFMGRNDPPRFAAGGLHHRLGRHSETLLTADGTSDRHMRLSTSATAPGPRTKRRSYDTW
jgi:hypothetical protein